MIKKGIVYISVCMLALAACNTQKQASNATTATPKSEPYETSMDGGVKVLKGLLTRQIIESDSSYIWFKQNYALGSADASAVDAFTKNGSKFQMVIFGGTWCEDTQNLLPAFYRLADKSGYKESSITLIGVNRQKQTLDNLSEAFHITNVPTFIVMKDGKEVGRVVEYGKSGQMDKELGEIVSGL